MLYLKHSLNYKLHIPNIKLNQEDKHFFLLFYHRLWPIDDLSYWNIFLALLSWGAFAYSQICLLLQENITVQSNCCRLINIMQNNKHIFVSFAISLLLFDAWLWGYHKKKSSLINSMGQQVDDAWIMSLVLVRFETFVRRSILGISVKFYD